MAIPEQSPHQDNQDNAHGMFSGLPIPHGWLRINDLEYGLSRISIERESKESPVTVPLSNYPTVSGWRKDYLATEHSNNALPMQQPARAVGRFTSKIIDVTFDDIGGHDSAKQVLSEVITHMQTGDLSQKWDAPIPKGLLLYGPSGSGMTMLTEAFARSAGADLLEVPISSVQSARYGKGQQAIRRYFKAASEHDRPVVLYFDKIETIIRDPSTIDSNREDHSVMNTFLQNMDNIPANGNVIVVGTTTTPESLSAEAVRSGRFDRKIRLDHPTGAARKDMLAKGLLAAERKTQRILVEDELDISAVEKHINGMTGADITEILNRVKRSLALTERELGKTVLIGGVEDITFPDNQAESLRITTQDIISSAINYRSERQFNW